MHWTQLATIDEGGNFGSSYSIWQIWEDHELKGTVEIVRLGEDQYVLRNKDIDDRWRFVTDKEIEEILRP